jgi:hypothetical protein
MTGPGTATLMIFGRREALRGKERLRDCEGRLR